MILGVRAGRERRCPWRAAAAAALVLLPWVAFALNFYGTVVPNTVFAKAAAYNAHIQGIQRNLLYTLNQFAPWSNLRPEFLFNLVIAPLLMFGVYDVFRHRRRLLAIPLFWITWWAYLVLPRTVLFLWYYPPMTTCAYVLAALGFSAGMGVSRRPPAMVRPPASPAPRCSSTWPPAAFPGFSPRRAARGWCRLPKTRSASRWDAGWRGTRRRTPGLRWNRSATSAITPGRPVLDEIGLVSPAMIPFTRSGAGWFGRAIRALRPDYVVERPWYLERNRTIITGLPMFATDEDRAWFVANYQPVKEFPEGGPLRLPHSAGPGLPLHRLPENGSRVRGHPGSGRGDNRRCPGPPCAPHRISATMSATIIDGKKIAAEVQQALRGRGRPAARGGGDAVAGGGAGGGGPRFANLRAQQETGRRRPRDCGARLPPPGLHPASRTAAAIAQRNADPSVHGILVQTPLPPGIDERAVLEQVAAAKDVDGLHPLNLGKLVVGPIPMPPCTPAGRDGVVSPDWGQPGGEGSGDGRPQRGWWESRWPC